MADLEKTLDDLKLLNALCHGTVLDDAIALLNEQQQIVRCKDCKHGEQSVLPHRDLWCEIHEFYREPNWFCADGEQRDL